ncbi:hypothetical protein RYA05_32185 [Pseudomonas syringae pv. actinidiae]|uniref:Uncharacterized protein n=2 Tax=Pseudomonas syringae TaxID=317 RepID=A0AAN4TLI8_PSESF|nr:MULTISPECIES: hypothetical protein [Pseudomonas syringae group]AKT30780.1 hypothetical protein IYO_014885 [Pseudomonas syringae pv. actinidiae ICMP 18884]AOE57196.1 hypothetical protein NZ708_14870 [Pseudomonas syringae pv. actinidiae ICMP 18708]EPM67432.1 hypothetical protein A3SM_30837 [Pseudomonas syringae pv. actinidiae ICMP 18886]EPN66939.1 hypothetical protein A234_31060 [Pseudomonas syringae pv. actinidiae ICMP 19101]EPN70347.1 hypothetical protein A235_04083 [Pseudomonas syringae pv
MHRVAGGARRLGKRVLVLDDAPFSGNKYLHAKLLHCLGVGTSSATPCYDGLSTLCAGILELRDYDVLIMEDVQRYKDVEWRGVEPNMATLVAIARLRRPPLIILSGLTDGVDYHHARFVDAGIPSELKVLQPMKLGDDYDALVGDICRAYSLGEDFVATLDLLEVYRKSHGRIGLTVRVIQWLELQARAIARASQSEIYQQLFVEHEHDEYSDDGIGDPPPATRV